MKVEVLKDGSCQFCGAGNDEKYKHIALYKTEDLDFFVKCDNCSAMTPKFDSSIAALAYWRAGDYTIPTHTERQIYEGCLSLMYGLIEDFKEWIEWQGIEVPDDERFQIGKYPTEIVNRLFLWHTTHSGGTSTRAKCRELGIEDSTKMIEFEVSEDEE